MMNLKMKIVTKKTMMKIVMRKTMMKIVMRKTMIMNQPVLAVTMMIFTMTNQSLTTQK